MPGFFWDDSKLLYNTFEGMEVELTACYKTTNHTKNILEHDDEIHKIQVRGIITDINITGQQLKMLADGLQGGRKLVAVIIKNRTSFLQKIEDTDFNKFLNTKSYFIFHETIYSIVDIVDYIHNNQTMFYCSYGGYSQQQ